MTAVSPATADALAEAMQRLLEGRPARTDGALTVEMHDAPWSAHAARRQPELTRKLDALSA